MPLAKQNCQNGCCRIGCPKYCHQWLINGRCEYGDRCSFCHSVPPWSVQIDERRRGRIREGSEWTLPSLKRTFEKAIGMMLDDSGRTHKRPYETDATVDDLVTFALYSGPEARLPCNYDLPQKEADEKAEEKAAPKKRPSKQRPKTPEPKKMPRKMHVFI